MNTAASGGNNTSTEPEKTSTPDQKQKVVYNTSNRPTEQVYYANVGGNIQQVSSNSVIMNGNKSIKLLMNMHNNTNTFTNQQQQQHQAINEASINIKSKEEPKDNNIPNMPNMNGDNTLLKALLQTAPKNATDSATVVNATAPNVNPIPVQLVTTGDQTVNKPPVTVTLSQDMLINPGPVVVKQESFQTDGSQAASPNVVANANSAEQQQQQGTKVKKAKANKQTKSQLAGVTVAEAAKSLGKATQAKSNVFKLNEGKHLINSHIVYIY